MKNKKISVIHFNILEKYPPVMNFIDNAISEKPNYQISIITSKNSSPYKDQKYNGVKIWRIGSLNENSIIRYFSYFLFNLLGSIILILKRPDVVLVYETISILPAYIYSIFFKEKKIHIHYHEYTSGPEKLIASKYVKFLFYFEAKLLKRYNCSHTNEDRKLLFLKDNPFLKSKNVEVYPNLPPSSWWVDYGQHKSPWKNGKIKLVYVGVLDIDTMYLIETLEWVKKNSEHLELTMFSQQYNQKTKSFIDTYIDCSICLKSAIDYFDLPKELVKYDVGLVLYKGHIPNYVYNIPNKVYEYLSCGLKIIADNSNVTINGLDLSSIFLLSFNEIKYLDLKKIQLLLENKNDEFLDKSKSFINYL